MAHDGRQEMWTAHAPRPRQQKHNWIGTGEPVLTMSPPRTMPESWLTRTWGSGGKGASYLSGQWHQTSGSFLDDDDWDFEDEPLNDDGAVSKTPSLAHAWE